MPAEKFIHKKLPDFTVYRKIILINAKTDYRIL